MNRFNIYMIAGLAVDLMSDIDDAYVSRQTAAARVRDFIAGMTDLYALRLYEKLFFPRTWPVL